MKRVQILGYSGSGKTTLANQLARKMGCEHIELDGLFWQENWQEASNEEFRRDVAEALRPESWVLCGDYTSRLEGYTLNQCDTVIILRYPMRIFIPRLISRGFRRSTKGELLWGKNKETYRGQAKLFWWVINEYRKEGRDRSRKKVEKWNFTGDILIFNTPKETEAWLKNL